MGWGKGWRPSLKADPGWPELPDSLGQGSMTRQEPGRSEKGPWPVPVSLTGEQTPAEQGGSHRGPGSGKRPPPRRKKHVFHVKPTLGGKACASTIRGEGWAWTRAKMMGKLQSWATPVLLPSYLHPQPCQGGKWLLPNGGAEQGGSSHPFLGHRRPTEAHLTWEKSKTELGRLFRTGIIHMLCTCFLNCLFLQQEERCHLRVIQHHGLIQSSSQARRRSRHPMCKGTKQSWVLVMSLYIHMAQVTYYVPKCILTC